jgi:hypothetical protein
MNSNVTLDKTVALALFQGCIGSDLGKSFHAFVYEMQPVKFSELKTKKGQARLIKMCKDEGYRADLINLTLDDIVATMRDKKMVTNDEAEAVKVFLTHIQAEQAASAIAKLVSECKQVITHPTIATSTELRDRMQRVA